MIDPDIKKASTPQSDFYCSEKQYDLVKEKIFARTWHLLGDTEMFGEKNTLYPVWFLKGCLNEPLLLSRNAAGETQLLSNVCTHRGFVLVEEKTQASVIRCRYHGRCFSPDGSFMSMPEFEEAENFPTRMDDLAQAHAENWKCFWFGALFPVMGIADLFEDIEQRLSWFPFDKLKLNPDLSKDYHIHANWALYCDNYLEGFHIPFVHKGLNKVIDYGNYETHLFRYGSLQTGIAKGDDIIFNIPANSPDAGKRIAAYYYWIFPNMMLNFYPWGLSVNIVEPKAVDQTTVRFLTYVADESKFNLGAGSDLHRVEMEDEEVVESVQRGLRSRLYFRGRYSPKMEKGVHHFHRLMYEFMNAKDDL